MNKIKTQTACAEKEPFALMVLGDDMSPEFLDGTVITVDPAHPLVSGAFVVVATTDDIFFRQYRKKLDKEYLQALNPEIDNIRLDANWELKGVVTQARYRRTSYFFTYENGEVKKYTKLRAADKSNI